MTRIASDNMSTPWFHVRQCTASTFLLAAASELRTHLDWMRLWQSPNQGELVVNSLTHLLTRKQQHMARSAVDYGLNLAPIPGIESSCLFRACETKQKNLVIKKQPSFQILGKANVGPWPFPSGPRMASPKTPQKTATKLGSHAIAALSGD